MSGFKRSSVLLRSLPRSAVAGATIVAVAVVTQIMATTARSDVKVVETGVLAASVTDLVTGEAVPGVVMSLEPPAVVDPHPTNRMGYVSARVQPGTYRFVLSREGYETTEGEVTVARAERSLSHVAMEPVAPVVVNAGHDRKKIAPGSTVLLEASARAKDGSQIESYRWELVEPGPGAARVELEDAAGAQVTVQLPGVEEYRASLRFLLGSEGRLLDRWSVVGLTPADLDTASRATLRVTVTTSTGIYSDDVHLYADLGSFATSSIGIGNVPVGLPVMVQGPRKEGGKYAWTLNPPQGSAAQVLDRAERTPYFQPDVPGAYEILEDGVRRLEVYAGTWRGAVYRRRMKNWPMWMDERGCNCHFEGPTESVFGDWWESGHAEIFSQVVDTSPRNSDACFACHTVGFDGDNGNGGIDEGPRYAAFRNDERFWDGHSAPPRMLGGAGTWESLLLSYPGVASFGNVQCDNCHGPTDSEAHQTLSKTGAPARISLSAQVCATCHQEPGDDSYREWRQTGHGGYGMAVAEAKRSRNEPEGECAVCHTAWGALAGTMSTVSPPVTREGEQYLSPAEAGSLRAAVDGVHPITCVVCHDPHAAGNSFRWQTEKVPVRSLAAYGAAPSTAEASQANRAELCQSCHRIRDGAWRPEAPNVGAAPHAPQSDFLVGKSAYFVDSAKVGSHARLIEDSCIWCHMKPVPEPSPTGYPRGDSRHSFKALRSDCFECHEEDDPPIVAMSMEQGELELAALKARVEEAIRAEMLAATGVRLVADGLDGGGSQVTAGEIESLELVIYRREMAVVSFDMAEPVPLRNVLLDGQPLPETGRGQILARSAWNYFLAELDGSNGGHNPLFLRELLEGTLGALEDLEEPKHEA